VGRGIAPAGEMAAAAAETVIGSVAHALFCEADDDRPIALGELPIGRRRFEGLLPPIVASPAFTIRKGASQLIPLEDSVREKVVSRAQANIIIRIGRMISDI
jgi:type IV secretion system protein TrbB